MNPSYAEILAHHVCELKYEQLSSSTIQKTKQCLLDYMGGVFHASDSATAISYISLAKELGGDGNAKILGSKVNTTASYAAFANAALGHIAETDDGHRASIMHIGTIVFPVILALRSEADIDGKDIIEASIAGYELAIRVGECLSQSHYNTWHTTATAGTFGAAAAAAKILKLSEEQTVWTLAHAGTQMAGLWQFLDDDCLTAKVLHPAKSAQNGIISAFTAKANIPGPANIFEGKRGVAYAYSTNSDLSYLIKDLGKNYKVDEANFKAYPTCGQTHSMIDALRKIQDEHEIDHSDVKNINVFVYQKTIDIANIEEPKTIAQAKFSVKFCLALLLVKGSISFTNIDEKSLTDLDIVTLMKKINVLFDEGINKDFPRCRPCKITLTTSDNEYKAENYYRRGDPETPMRQDEVENKFRELTNGFLSKPDQEKYINWVSSIETTTEWPF
jgi:2-methylcitrate dehydratase PrpD